MRLVNVAVLSVMLVFLTIPVFAKDVSFATFNLYWLFDDKAPQLKWFDKERGAQGQTYEQAISLVAENIKVIDADIIGLQEIENEDVLRTLQSKLNDLGVVYRYRYICRCTDNYTGQDVALLSKYAASGAVISSFEGREGYLTEEDRFNEDSTRLSKALMVPFQIESQIVNVFVFHLKAQPGGYESDKQRQAQASLIRRVTLPYLNASENVVVLGDLNAEPGSTSLYRIRGFEDVYSDLYQTTNHEKFTGNKTTYIFNGRHQQIDHILLSEALYSRFKTGNVISGHNKSVSDHNAVKVVIKGF